MKLSEWARCQGIHPKTAYRWFREGKLPVPATRTPTGTILVDAAPNATGDQATVVYARVSSHDQADGLAAQVGRVTDWASRNGLSVDRVVTEVGSGLNGKRPKFARLLADPTVGTILVEHRDRATRFGFDYIESALAAQGRSLLAADPRETDDDLVRDMVEVLTSFCARLYGKRGARNRAEKALRAAKSNVGVSGH